MESKHLRMALLAPESHPGDYSGGLTSGGVPGVTCEKSGCREAMPVRKVTATAGDGSPRLASAHCRPASSLEAMVKCLHILKHPVQRPSSCSPGTPGPHCRCTMSQGPCSDCLRRGAWMLPCFLRVLAALPARLEIQLPESRVEKQIKQSLQHPHKHHLQGDTHTSDTPGTVPPSEELSIRSKG